MPKNIKRPKKIAKPCTECFAPIYLKFNFAYVSCDSNFDGNDKYEAQLLKRMRELSDDVYTVVKTEEKRNLSNF